MFSFDSIVDTVTGAQTKFVETFVVDKNVQAEVVKLVEAQAKFTKTTYKNSLETAETAAKYFTDTVKVVNIKKAGA
jgi:hypothetical protein